MKYELWIQEGLTMSIEKLSRSKFKFKTQVFLNITKILRLIGIVPAKHLRNIFAIFDGNFLNAMDSVNF